MNINFKVIPHGEQRYDTVGDYYHKNGLWRFRVSKLGDPCYEMLVFLHEMIEFMLCRVAGIKPKDIDRWDLEYESTRAMPGRKLAPCECTFYEEPGDDPHAPYHAQHQVASKCERLIAEALGVKWDAYEASVERL